MKKLCLRLLGRWTYIFLKFWHFNFSIFQKTFLEKFMKKLPGFKTYFESTDKVLPLHQYLWSEISWQWNNDPLNFFWSLHGRAICFLNFSNEGNIKASILSVLLKCSFVGCSNGNESFTGRLFSNYGPLNMLFHFFRYLICNVFQRLLSKHLWWNYPFSVQISKINFKM